LEEAKVMSEQTLDWLGPFDGANLATELGRAAILSTVDAEGWAHQAYLSAGEILAQGERISLALWPSSRTTANLDRDGRGVLFTAYDGAVWEGRLELTRRPGPPADGAVIFDGRVIASRRHAAPYAEVLGLVAFQLHDSAATLARWSAQLDRLRDRAGG
jgi:hypothetical protein